MYEIFFKKKNMFKKQLENILTEKLDGKLQVNLVLQKKQVFTFEEIIQFKTKEKLVEEFLGK